MVEWLLRKCSGQDESDSCNNNRQLRVIKMIHSFLHILNLFRSIVVKRSTEAICSHKRKHSVSQYVNESISKSSVRNYQITGYSGEFNELTLSLFANTLLAEMMSPFEVDDPISVRTIRRRWQRKKIIRQEKRMAVSSSKEAVITSSEIVWLYHRDIKRWMRLSMVMSHTSGSTRTISLLSWKRYQSVRCRIQSHLCLHFCTLYSATAAKNVTSGKLKVGAIIMQFVRNKCCSKASVAHLC